MQNVSPVAKYFFPHDANVAGSHVLYKVKKADDGSLKLKARMTLSRTKDDLKLMLTKDWTVCSLT